MSLNYTDSWCLSEETIGVQAVRQLNSEGVPGGIKRVLVWARTRVILFSFIQRCKKEPALAAYSTETSLFL